MGQLYELSLLSPVVVLLRVLNGLEFLGGGVQGGPPFGTPFGNDRLDLPGHPQQLKLPQHLIQIVNLPTELRAQSIFPELLPPGCQWYQCLLFAGH